LLFASFSGLYVISLEEAAESYLTSSFLSSYYFEPEAGPPGSVYRVLVVHRYS